MFCDDPAILAQANYLRNWMSHTNRYTGRKYKDEPAICAFEVMNEPAYADYSSMKDPKACYYPTEPEALAPAKVRLNRKWQKWCETNGVEDEPRFFPMFRYEVFTRYLDTMYDAIRSTGAKQPIACALFDTTGREDLISAIADSKCEAVTTGAYAGAWDKVGDGVNYLPWAINEPLSPKLNGKARLVYEFDGIKTFGSYFYPAMARRFRNLGVQICCMFQYDSGTTAEWNTDWDAHYLNWLYTPGKATSFHIGGKVFRDLARGSTFPTKGTTQQFGNCAVSFDRNISIYCNKSTYINSAPYSSWAPLRLPKKPMFIMGVGDSPFAAYSGTGVYMIDVDYSKGEARLTVNPDADIVGDPWHPNPAKSAVKLRNRSHRFVLKLPGISPRSVLRQSDGNTVELNGNAFDVSRGKYLIVW